MTLILASLALVAQFPFVDLSQPDRSDGLSDVAFAADGDALVISHSDTSSVVYRPLVPGIPGARASVGSAPINVEVTPDGARAVLTYAGSADLTILSLPQLDQATTIPLSGGVPERLLMHPGSTLAITVSTPSSTPASISVVDLVAGVELTSIPLGFASNPVHEAPTVLVNGATQLLTVVSNPPSTDLALYDLATGALLQQVPTGRVVFDLKVNGAGTEVAVLQSGIDPAQPSYTLARLEVATLATLASYEVPTGFVQQTDLYGYAAQDQTIIGRFGSRTGLIDIASGGYNDLGEGIPSMAITGDGRFVVGRALSLDKQMAVFDASNAGLVGLYPVRDEHRQVASHAGSNRVATFQAGLDLDRVTVTSITGPGALASLDLSSSNVPEMDGPIDSALVQKESVLVLSARDSDSLHFVDAASGVETQRLNVAPGPVRLEPRSPETLFVLHERGAQLSVLDVLSRTISLAIPLPGEGTQLHPVPGTTRAWVRTDSPGQGALCLVETEGPATGVLATIPLAGRDNRVLLSP